MKHQLTCADLGRPTTLVLLDTVLFLLIAGSYIPQLRLILVRRSTSGLTQSYVLFTYLFMASQFGLIMIYSSYARPIMDCIRDQKLKGWIAYGALIGVLQMTFLWIGSASLLLTFLLYPNTRDNGYETNSSLLDASSSSTTRRPYYPKTMLSICIIHASIWVLPAIVISLARRIDEPIFHPARLFVGLGGELLIPTCIGLVSLIFPLQIRELLVTRCRMDELDLSPTTLAVQSGTCIVLAFSWKLYIGQPGSPFNIIPPGATQPWIIYHLGGWQWINNLIFGLGQGLLLLVYLWVGSRQRASREYASIVDETTRLL